MRRSPMQAIGIGSRQRLSALCAALALLLVAAADASVPRHKPAAAVGPHSARGAAREAPRSIGRDGLGGRRLLEAGAANRWVDQVYVHGSGSGGAHGRASAARAEPEQRGCQTVRPRELGPGASPRAPSCGASAAALQAQSELEAAAWLSGGSACAWADI